MFPFPSCRNTFPKPWKNRLQLKGSKIIKPTSESDVVERMQTFQETPEAEASLCNLLGLGSRESFYITLGFSCFI